jgi:hypothetical protein
MRTLAARIALSVWVCALVVGAIGVVGRVGAGAPRQPQEPEPVGLLPYYRQWGTMPAEAAYAWDAVADLQRDRLYVATSTAMLAFDTKQGTSLGSVELPYPANLIALSRDGQRAYLTESSGNGVAVVMIVNTQTLKREKNVAIPCEAEMSPCRALSLATGPGNRLYIAADRASGVYALDGVTGVSLGILPQEPPGSPLAVAAAGDHLYSLNSIFHDNGGRINRWDVSSGTAVFEVSHLPDPAPGLSDLIAGPDDSFLVLSELGSALRVVDSETLEVRKEIETNGSNFAGVAGTYFQQAHVAADSRSIVTHVSGENGLAMIELDRDSLAPIRLARDYQASGFRPIEPLARGNLAIVGPDRVTLFSPNNYVVALPLTFETHCGSGPIRDSFDDPTSGWPVDSDANATVGYLNGSYQIKLNKPERLMAVSRGDSWYNGDLYQVDAWLQSGEPGSFGIVFGLNANWTEFYTMEVYTAEEYQDRFIVVLHYTARDGWKLVQLYPEMFGVNPGPEPNTIQMYLAKNYEGERVLELKINYGEALHLSPSISGRVGLIGTSSRTSGADLRFDDYRFIGQNCTFAPGPDDGLETRIIERPDLSQLIRELRGGATRLDGVLDGR